MSQRVLLTLTWRFPAETVHAAGHQDARAARRTSAGGRQM